MSRATYRIQLRDQFPLAALRGILDYLDQLGISTVYASPILAAVPGSNHGYDVTDPRRINPEIGSREEFRAIGEDLRARGMDWLQDIVPNHMAFAPENGWMDDLLRRGPASAYARFFDIVPAPGNEKPMVPFLGKDLADCLREGSLRIEGDRVRYFDASYPLNRDAADYGDKQQQKSRTVDGSAPAAMQAKEGSEEAESQTLARLLSEQHYRLCSWRETMTRINYRRFFAVNSLICLRAEEPAVFDACHGLLFDLHREGLIQGFRIDHIDGLYDPEAYIDRLRAALKPGTWLLAEKILQAGEKMPASWALDGESGYEFLALVNGLLTDKRGLEKIEAAYLERVPTPPYARLVYEKKFSFLQSHFAGELDNLLRLLAESFGAIPGSARKALAEIMAWLPVYRPYPRAFPLEAADARYVAQAFENARRNKPELENSFGWLQTLFQPAADEATSRKRLAFIRRWSQFTGPLAAKGTEDTVFYTWNALISRNEVGDSPGEPPVDAKRFHEAMRRRGAETPRAMNTTGTHDTKRGEDARVRINLLTVFADEWIRAADDWRRLNAAQVRGEGEARRPSVNDEYMIYQALVGSYPADGDPDADYEPRFLAWLEKALREAKAHTNHEDPDLAYEDDCKRFVRQLLLPDTPFRAAFLPFFRRVAEAGFDFSLVQQAVKLTAPGIPDLYQGSELWDLSFVDPDNRRLVDYDARRAWLRGIIEREQDWGALLAWLREHRASGVEKLYITRQLLQFRKSRPALFAEGDYRPVLATNGLIAWERSHENHRMLLVARLPCAGKPEPAPLIGFEGAWTELFTGERYPLSLPRDAYNCLGKFPVACLVASLI